MPATTDLLADYTPAEIELLAAVAVEQNDTGTASVGGLIIRLARCGPEGMALARRIQHRDRQQTANAFAAAVVAHIGKGDGR